MRNLLLLPCFFGIAVAQDGDHSGPRTQQSLDLNGNMHQSVSGIAAAKAARNLAGEQAAVGDTLQVPDHFATIAAAVQAAVAGQVVHVRAGTYAEDIHMKAGVHLAGDRSGATSIHGTVHVANAAEVRLSRLHISAPVGLYISNAPGTVVQGCRITGATWGVVIHGCAPVLEQNLIADNTCGVYLGDNAGTGLEARQNLVAENDIGVLARSTPNLHEGGNSLRGNGRHDIEATAGSGYLVAAGNWWGENPPDPAQIKAAHGVYYSGYLTQDPMPGSEPVPALLRRSIDRPQLSEDEERARMGYAEARRRLDAGQRARAARLYAVLLERYAASPLAAVALKDLVGLYHDMGQPHRARSVLRHVEAPLQTTAQRLEFDLLLLEKRYDRALALGEELVQHWAGRPEGEEVALHMARVECMDRKRVLGQEALRAFLMAYPARLEDRDSQIRRQMAQALMQTLPPSFGRSQRGEAASLVAGLAPFE